MENNVKASVITENSVKNSSVKAKTSSGTKKTSTSTKKKSPKDEFIETLKKRDKAVPAVKKMYRYRGKESEQLRCPECGSVLKSYDRFCSWCGQRIQENSQNSEK